MNVGASAPEEAGLYFSWGNSPGHAEGSGYDFSLEVYSETPAAAIEANLTLAEDMARQSLGAPWRMPTAAEFQELIDNCTAVWTTLNGVAGYLCTSNVNGNSIFIPAAGVYEGTSLNDRGNYGGYWSSSYESDESAGTLDSFEADIDPMSSNRRCNGLVVRAVQ